jgi:hypothetical protein
MWTSITLRFSESTERVEVREQIHRDCCGSSRYPRFRPAAARRRALPPIRRKGHPPPVAVRLLIDTGSRRSTLIPGLFRHLLAPAAGDAQVVSAVGAVRTDLFWVCLDFPDTGLAEFPEVLVARLPMPAALSQFHGLLGRDLLRRFDSFEYEGRRGCYSLRDRPGVFTWLRRWL